MDLPPCDRCGDPQVELGALLLGPPTTLGMVRKFHLCVQCFEVLAPIAEPITEPMTLPPHSLGCSCRGRGWTCDHEGFPVPCR